MVLNEALTKYVAQIISGIANGSIYGLFALSIVFLYRANRLFNLAATSLATFFAICMFFLLNHLSYYSAFAVTMVIAFFGGLILHFGLMRIVTERKNVLHSNETVVTIGIFTVLNSLSSLLSDESQRFPAPFHESMIKIWGINVPSQALVILGFAIMTVIALYLFLKITRIGLIMEATAQNLNGARLCGIKTSNILALAWGLTTAVSAAAGILIAPVFFLSADMLRNVFSYALIAVVIGGLESPFGALVGGIVIGVVENLSTNLSFIGSELKFISIFFLLLAVLIIKPRGIWGREEHRRV